MAHGSNVSAEVAVSDAAVSFGRTVILKAVTKGRMFPEGGKIVEFFEDGKRIGRTLSGGDGYAFLKYTPDSPGIKILKASSGDESDEGTILVTEKRDRVIIVGIESSLSADSLFLESLQEGKEAILRLEKKFMIIYVSTIMGVKRSRGWLKTNSYPVFPVLNWGTDTVSDLQEHEVKIYAVVGSPEMISQVKDVNKKFSFEETEEATVVKDWKEIVKQLKLPR